MSRRSRINLVALCALFVFALLPAADAQQPPPAAGPAAEGISFSAQVDKTEVAANEPFDLSVVVKWSGAADTYGLDRIEPPELDNLRILGSRTEATKSITGEKLDFIRKTTYRLQPEAEGRASIGPATAYYREQGADDLKMMTSDRIEVTVGPPEVGLFEVKRNVQIALFAGGLIVLAIVLLVVRAVVVRRARAQAEREAAKEPAPIPQYEAAMEDVSAHLQSGDFAAFFRAIDGAVRRLAIRQAKLPARAETIPDLTARLRSAGFNPLAIESIEILLRECENARFTGRTPTHSEASVFLARAKGLPATIARASGGPAA